MAISSPDSGSTPQQRLWALGEFCRGDYRVIADHLGSVRFVVHQGTGAIAQAIEYDEYGRVLADSAPGFQPFGFAGGIADRTTGFVRFGARDYDSASGSWTSKDSARFAAGLNFYSYVENEPVNYIDTSGNAAMAATWTIGIAIRVIGGRAASGFLTRHLVNQLGREAGAAVACGAFLACNEAEGDGHQETEKERERGLPPDGLNPTVDGECKVGPASRESERAKGGKSLYDNDGGEWRYHPEDRWHNPHWHYNRHNAPNSPWTNVPIDGLPPVRG